MIDFVTLRLKRSPNQYLVAPKEYCKDAKPHREAPIFSASAIDVRKAWKELLSKQPRITISRDDESALQLEVVQRSAVLRFPDTITVKFIQLEAPDQSTVAVYSRSTYGYKDFGVNKKRIDSWLSELHKLV